MVSGNKMRDQASDYKLNENPRNLNLCIQPSAYQPSAYLVNQKSKFESCRVP